VTDPLTTLWRRWDAGAVLHADDTTDWPPGTVERFATLGWVRELSAAGSVACDACGDGHDARVTWVGEGAGRRGRYRCPTEGHVRVDPARVRRWDADGERVAAAVADAVGVAGGVTASVPGRVWRLGKVAGNGKVWTAFVARGLNQPDGESVVTREPGLTAANALVFVPGEQPPRVVWGSGAVPIIVRLSDVLMLTPSGLRVDREFLASSCGGDSKAVAVATFPTPAGTTWKDVTLTVGDRVLTVTVGDVARRFTLTEVGFADRKANGKPDRVWAILNSIATNSGLIPDGTKRGGVDKNVKQAMTELRTRLRSILGLVGDPIPHDSQEREYRAAFRVRADSPATFTLPDGSGWDVVSITERADATIEVVVDGTGHTDGFDDRAGDGGDLVAAERTTAWSRRVPLTALGLATDGVPTPEGEALLAVLRGGGKVAAKPTDRAFLKLGKILATAFQTTDPAFDYRDGKWVAKFTADSHAYSSASSAGARVPAAARDRFNSRSRVRSSSSVRDGGQP
jgi:hypothetical protein